MGWSPRRLELGLDLDFEIEKREPSGSCFFWLGRRREVGASKGTYLVGTSLVGMHGFPASGRGRTDL